jgi:prevent-host-death family protein
VGFGAGPIVGSAGATLSHMAEISVRELRNRTSDVVARVEAGEALTLTVRGRPVADIVPHTQRREAIPAEEFFAGLRDAYTGIPTGPSEPRSVDLTSDDLVDDARQRLGGSRGT